MTANALSKARGGNVFAWSEESRRLCVAVRRKLHIFKYDGEETYPQFPASSHRHPLQAACRGSGLTSAVGGTMAVLQDVLANAQASWSVPLWWSEGVSI